MALQRVRSNMLANNFVLDDDQGLIVGSGNNIYIDTVNNRVGINTNSPTHDFTVAGNIHATGNITAGGDITIGDSDTDTLTITAEIGSDILPDIDNTYDLGSAAKKWAEVHATTFYGDGSQLTGIAATLDDILTNGNTSALNIDLTGGTVTATSFIGDGSQLTGLASTLDEVTTNGATTTNSITVGGLIVNSSGALGLPVGTTAQRPTAADGLIRFNSDLVAFEGYDGVEWGALGGGGATYSATAPTTNLKEGDLWFDTGTTGELYVYSGTEWLSVTGAGGSAFYQRGFLGDGSTTAFNVYGTGTSTVVVYINGVFVTTPADYSYANGVVTFVTPPALNDEINVLVYGETTGISLSLDSLTDVDLTTTAPTDGQVLVYDISGNKFVPGDSAADFTDLTGSLALNQIPDALITPAKLQNSITISDEFTASGSTADFTLSRDPGSAAAIQVYVDSVPQLVSNYTVNGTTLTLAAAPSNGSIVEVRGYGVASSVGTPTDLSVTTNKIANGAVTAAKLDSAITTDDITEGSTNLYYTDARVDARVNAQTGANLDLSNKSTTDLAEGTNLYYTDSRVDARLAGGSVGNIVTTGYLAGPATFTIDPAAVGDNTGTVVIAGDLQVDGTTTTINSTTLEVDDKNVILSAGSPNAAGSDGAGITVDNGSDADATILYDGINDEWEINKDLDVTGNITVSGTVDGRNVATDGSKLDGIEASADVTDTANVTAAGALMDSELTDIAAVKALDQGVATTNSVTFAGVSTDNFDLSAIDTTISDTAVDVFVYDTRKDSDGGAWRKRTQHTSWYNETLNTSTRGSRREFPAVAVIVTESLQVTIYDGDDPDLPMWMVFNEGTASYISSNGNALTSVNASNGMLIVGTFRLQVINFVSDSGWKSEDNWYYYSIKPISARNETYTTGYNNTGPRIVNNTINDVAMTALPNAPIDSATGLPVPTIAVATAGGTSIIRDDGTVVDVMSGTNAYGVEFTKNNELLHTANDANSTFSIQVRDIPGSDTTAASSRKYNHTGSGEFTTPPISGISNESTSKKLAILPNHVIASATLGSSTTGGKPALNLLQEALTSPANGMVNYITSDYNTGWQVGDIKLATLSDTDDTDVTGAELVTNGTFDSDTSGWTDYTSSYMTVSHASGAARITHASNWSGWYGIGQDITTVVGQTYVASYDVTESDSGNMQGSHFYLGTDTVLWGVSGTYEKSGTITGTFVATSTTTNIRTGHGGVGVGSGDYYTIDNFTVRLAEEDRSVNGNGLQVFGTVTKNPVATGADLVSYGGFSGSNYLMQPYNSDFNFGTGDWSVNCWFKIASGTNTAVMLSWRNSGGATPFWQIYQTNTTINFDLSDGVSGGMSISTTYRDDQWHMLTFLARGPNLREAWVDGKLIGSNTTTLSTGVTGGSDHEFKVGQHYDGAFSYTGSVALLRVSSTAPSPEQIKKIYDDEKFLFQENAKATLYGSSDAVTALAYDDDTELLHAGTSAGRSVFRGLRRIDNTTDAVGATISASNGLVAED